jgi:hypothetical protein
LILKRSTIPRRRKVKIQFPECRVQNCFHLKNIPATTLVHYYGTKEKEAEIATLDTLKQPPFSSIGDPEQLFKKPELDELLDLIHTIAV